MVVSMTPSLCDLYAGARAAILPLRYGAGVKGKLIEAFQNLVPVVSTTHRARRRARHRRPDTRRR